MTCYYNRKVRNFLYLEVFDRLALVTNLEKLFYFASYHRDWFRYYKENLLKEMLVFINVHV
jgi:hypothetical protein